MQIYLVASCCRTAPYALTAVHTNDHLRPTLGFLPRHSTFSELFFTIFSITLLTYLLSTYANIASWHPELKRRGLRAKALDCAGRVAGGASMARDSVFTGARASMSESAMIIVIWNK